MIRVIIVDDDPLVRQGIRELMPWAAHGMEVTGEAGNGREACEFLQSNKVDVALVDLDMPIMGGMEFIEKASALYPALRYVILTVHTEFERIQKAMRLGAIDYIAKTQFDEENFDAILERIAQKLTRTVLCSKSQWFDTPQTATHQPYTGAFNMTSDQTMHQATTSAVLNDIEKEWLSLNWTLDKGALDTLLLKTRGTNVAGGVLYGLLVKTEASWDASFGALVEHSAELPYEFADWSEAASWLRHLKALVDDFCLHTGHPADVVRRILHVKTFLDSHYADNIEADEMARIAAMSGGHFSRCFRSIIGITFSEYLTSVRIEGAKEVLRTTDKSIQEVTATVGYNDEKYFSRAFKKAAGVTPSKWRATCRT